MKPLLDKFAADANAQIVSIDNITDDGWVWILVLIQLVGMRLQIARR